MYLTPFRGFNKECHSHRLDLVFALRSCLTVMLRVSSCPLSEAVLQWTVKERLHLDKVKKKQEALVKIIAAEERDWTQGECIFKCWGEWSSGKGLEDIKEGDWSVGCAITFSCSRVCRCFSLWLGHLCLLTDAPWRHYPTFPLGLGGRSTLILDDCISKGWLPGLFFFF